MPAVAVPTTTPGGTGGMARAREPVQPPGGHQHDDDGQRHGRRRG
ncbi:hypothetical protein [Ralstonia sp. 25mfcol4.1]|nr:hypothetical protein [Ralstonia sp. 25mfcol4.1]